MAIKVPDVMQHAADKFCENHGIDTFTLGGMFIRNAIAMSISQVGEHMPEKSKEYIAALVKYVPAMKQLVQKMNDQQKSGG